MEVLKIRLRGEALPFLIRQTRAARFLGEVPKFSGLGIQLASSYSRER